MSNKIEELMNAAKINEMFHKKRMDDEKKNSIVWVLAIIGAIATVAAIAFAVYKYFAPNYLDDYDDDDFYDDFDDDFDDDLECECCSDDKTE